VSCEVDSFLQLTMSLNCCFVLLLATLIIINSLFISSSISKQPNIVFILADDLGWGNVGYHNPNSSEIWTPNIDELARSGLILDRHYVHYVCCPSRTSFQSGRLPVHVNIVNCNPPTHPQSGIPQNMTAIGTKMQQAGFQTHIVGKWHAGMATFEHTPLGRGYDTSLIYFSATIEYWNHSATNCYKADGHHYYDIWNGTQPAYEYGNITDVDEQQYIEYVFAEQVHKIIADYAPKPKSPKSGKSNNIGVGIKSNTDVDVSDADDEKAPFFLVYTPHLVHSPQQIPEQHLLNFSNDEDECAAHTGYVYPHGFNSSQPAKFHCRSQYLSMVHLLDIIVGNISEQLRSIGLWDNTLLVFSSDNGGPVGLSCCGGNNYPLRGAKQSVWEGGIRAVAFITGGYLPAHRRGQIENGMMHLSGLLWLRFFCVCVLENKKQKTVHINKNVR
jgi:arylsulfatase I/J